MGNLQKWTVAILIASFMLQVGLAAPPRSLRRVSPAAIARGLVVMFVLGPAIAWAVVQLLAPPRIVAVALIVMSTVGVVPLAARGVTEKQGCERTALALTFILGVAAIFLAVPISRLLLSTSRQVDLPAGRLLVQLLAIQFLPLAIGAVVARVTPRAPAIANVVAKANVVVLLIAVAVVIVPKLGAMIALGARGAIATVIMAVALGAVAHAVGGPAAEERRAIVSISNRPNVGLALAIAAGAHAPKESAAAAIAIFVTRFVVGGLVDFSLQRTARRKGRGTMLVKHAVSVTLVLAMLAPAVASAQTTGTNGNPPERERGEYRGPNKPLLITSAITFGAPYLTSALVAATTESHANNMLYIPAVGPWLTLGQRKCTDNDPCEAEILTGGMLVADGLLQGAGVIGMVVAFAAPDVIPSMKVGNTTVSVAPSKMGKSGYGLAAVAEF